LNEKVTLNMTRPDISCCDDHHERSMSVAAVESRQLGKRYFCPMCGGVESDTPGSCPKCGMSLERNPVFREPKKTIYTCPMHPQIEQDHPGNCPICGMTLEPKTVGLGDEEQRREVNSLSRKFLDRARAYHPGAYIAMDMQFPDCTLMQLFQAHRKVDRV